MSYTVLRKLTRPSLERVLATPLKRRSCIDPEIYTDQCAKLAQVYNTTNSELEDAWLRAKKRKASPWKWNSSKDIAKYASLTRHYQGRHAIRLQQEYFDEPAKTLTKPLIAIVLATGVIYGGIKYAQSRSVLQEQDQTKNELLYELRKY